MSKDNMKQCTICGRYTSTMHHLVFGNGKRELCDIDAKCGSGMLIPMCDNCHTLGRYRLHDNPTAERLSKMLEQALWERWYITDYGDAQDTSNMARDKFIERYGVSWL